MKRHFMKGDIDMANKDLRRYLELLAISKIQSNTTMYHMYPLKKGKHQMLLD